MSASSHPAQEIKSPVWARYYARRGTSFDALNMLQSSEALAGCLACVRRAQAADGMFVTDPEQFDRIFFVAVGT